MMEEFNLREQFSDFLRPYKGKELSVEFIKSYHLKIISLLDECHKLTSFSDNRYIIMSLELDSLMISNMDESVDFKMIKIILDSYRYKLLILFRQEQINNSH